MSVTATQSTSFLSATEITPSSSKFSVLPPTPPLSDDEYDEDVSQKARLQQVADRPRASLQSEIVFERYMGSTELSYFLPSRADGVNDMFVSPLNTPIYLVF